MAWFTSSGYRCDPFLPDAGCCSRLFDRYPFGYFARVTALEVKDGVRYDFPHTVLSGFSPYGSILSARRLECLNDTASVQRVTANSIDSREQGHLEMSA